MTVKEKAELIIRDIRNEEGSNPVRIFKHIAAKDYMSIHGPEHHILDGTGPLSSDGTWGCHMQYTSAAIQELGVINGPRCCKRDAMVAFKNAVDYVNRHHDVQLEYEHLKCEFSGRNEQCLKERCPYYL